MGWKCSASYSTPFENAGMCNGELSHICSDYDLKFHESWDWLMPVIDKIYSSENYAKYKDSLGPFGDGVFINTKYIESTFNDVVDYIVWNNV
jgi:hypothetical protein